MTMYGYAEKLEKQELPTVPGVICPECYHHLVSPSVLPQERHGSGNTIRSYFGWCFGCQKGYAAFQFFNPSIQRWVLWRYKEYVLNGGKPVLNHQDHVVCPIPEIPVVHKGCGEFAQSVAPTDIAMTVTHTKEVMVKVAAILCELKSTLNQIVGK